MRGWSQAGRARRASIATLLLVLAALVGPAPASGGGVRVSGPLVRLEPSEVDFGELAQGEMVRIEITIHNDGSEPLEIRNIDSDCACTVAQIPDSTLAPGESTVMRATVQTRSFSGKIMKQVFVFTNDPAAPKATVKLRAFVRPPVSLRPPTVRFGDVPIGEPRRETVTLKAAARDTLRILSLDFPERILRCSSASSQEGDSTVLRVELELKSDAPPGPFRVTGKIATNHAVNPMQTLLVTGQVHGFFRVDPEAVSFGQVLQGRSRTETIRVIPTASGNRRVTGVSCDRPFVGSEVVPLPEGQGYEVRATLLPSAPPERLTGTLRITTDDPRQPSIELDIRGSVRPTGVH